LSSSTVKGYFEERLKYWTSRNESGRFNTTCSVRPFAVSCDST
jgi:hypothetical protein